MGKTGKRYGSYELITVIGMSIFLYFILIFAFLLQEDKSMRIVGGVALMPITTAITRIIITLIIKSNSFIDVKLCNHRYILSKGVVNFWATSKVDQGKLGDWTFAEISNIGKTMVTRLKIVVNDDKKNQSYTIQYALKKNDVIYFAIPKKIDDIKCLTVTDYAGRDSTRDFYGELTETGDVYIFSKSDDLKKNKKPVPESCYRQGLQRKPPQS
jgi:hypothetical protein